MEGLKVMSSEREENVSPHHDDANQMGLVRLEGNHSHQKPAAINPFASIERTGTSNPKVKVKVSCLNISFMS